MPIRVLIVDDSAFVRRALERVIATSPEFEVVASAANGRLALEALTAHTVDAVVLDVEMPVMDGLETLKALRERDRGLPVVMFSTLTTRGGEATLEALSLGANDYVTKPTQQADIEAAFASVRNELLPRLRSLVEHHWARVGRPAHAGPRRATDSGPIAPVPTPASTRPTAAVEPPPTSTAPTATTRSQPRTGTIDVVAIGVSTGGPNALHALFTELPVDIGVPVVVVQHMPPLFTGLLAQRLDASSAWEVREARAGDELLPGRVLLAPGDHHLGVVRDRGTVRARLDQSAPVNSCRPSVDVLLRSVAEVYGGNVLAVVLTGMGRDGLDGCRVLVAKGAQCIVQDEGSSVVWGMPGYVAKEGLADEVVPLDAMARRIATRVRAARRVPHNTSV